ncbi:radical SAM protein [Bacteriovoracaceae bacterium]|nr:radical SAM protein [Bacteriovoracaceae bacterium]
MTKDNNLLIKLQLDGNKMLKHLDHVTKWNNGELIYPIYIAFSPSSLCNHTCNFCVYHYKKFEPIYFPKDRYFSLVDEWKKLGVKSIFFAGDGEPLLNKGAIEMIAYTRNSGIDISMNTNGIQMTPEKSETLVKSLDWIRISVNGGRNSYSKVHGTREKDFDRVIDNIVKLVEKKRELGSEIVIGVQCVLLEENKDDIEDLCKLLKKIGVDYFSVKPFLKHPGTEFNSEIKNKNLIIENLLKLERYSDDNFSFLLRENNFKSENFSRPYKKCLSGRFMIEIDARGGVYSCGPYIGEKRHCYGNVLNQSFDEMWKSERCQKVMDYIQNSLDVSKCMPYCRPDSVNSFLWELKNPPQHVNYI